MTTPIAPTAARAAPRADAATHARRAGSATRRTVSILGAVVALAGIEHGVGEILQGNVAPDGRAILSWPESDAFRVLAGEPAMTVVPNLLATGILAVFASLLFLAWATMFIQRRHGGLVLMALSVMLLLLGGGFAPPLIGLVLGLAATRIHAPVGWWGPQPSGAAPRVLGRAWPWFLGVEVAALLALFPGVVLVGAIFGGDAVPEALAYALMAAAFVFLPLSLVAALASDAWQQAVRSTSRASALAAV